MLIRDSLEMRLILSQFSLHTIKFMAIAKHWHLITVNSFTSSQHKSFSHTCFLVNFTLLKLQHIWIS